MSEKPSNFIIVFFVLILALIIPLPLIPVETILPYPYIIEELAKASLIVFILKLSSSKLQLKITILSGFIISASENIFYLTNFITNNLMSFYWQRVLMTTVLHILTMIIILLPSQKKKSLIVPATFLAMLVHFFYNIIVPVVFK